MEVGAPRGIALILGVWLTTIRDTVRFEPGHSTPEFEQFARENQKYRKASHARGGAGGQKRMPSSGARSRSAAAGGAGPRAAGSRNANSRVASSRSGSPRAAAPAGRGGSPSSGSAGRHASRGAGKTLPQTRAADSRKTAGRTAAPMQKAPSRSSRPVSSQPPLQAPEPQPVLARAHGKAHNVIGVLVCVLLAIALEVFGYNFQFFYSMTYPDAGSYLVNGAQPSQVGTITLDSSSSSFEITGLNSTVRSIHFTPVLSDAAGAAKATDSEDPSRHLACRRGQRELLREPGRVGQPRRPRDYLHLARSRRQVPFHQGEHDEPRGHRRSSGFGYLAQSEGSVRFRPPARGLSARYSARSLCAASGIRALQPCSRLAPGEPPYSACRARRRTVRGRACARALQLALRVLDADAVLREPVPVSKARRRAHSEASVLERRALRRAAGDGEPLRYAGACGAGRALSLGPCVLPREVLRLLRHPAVPGVLRAVAARDTHGLSDVARHRHLRLRLCGGAYVPALGGVPSLVPAHVDRGARGGRCDAVRRGRRYHPRAHAVDVFHA